MIKAIIFDCFGVLVSEAWEPFCDKYYGVGTELRQQASDLGKQLNLGFISYQEFIKAAADLAGTDEEIAKDYIDSSKPNVALLELIRSELKPNYKIGMLSNAGDNWVEQLFQSADLDLFDSIVLSHKFKYVKPQPEIYQIATNELGVQAEECVFVDDIERYTQAAETVSMKTIHYRDFNQFKQDLDVILSSS